MRGPVVMVKSTVLDGGIPNEEELNLPCDWLKVDGDPHINRENQFHTNQQLKPFYATGVGEYYCMYFNRDGKKFIPADKIELNGKWEARENGFYSDQQGATFETEFEGTTVVWDGLRHKGAGTATVYIDDKKIAEVDQYGYTDVYVPRYDQRKVIFRWSKAGLEEGKHKIKVVVSGAKEKLSSGTEINVSGITTYI
jgi:uncharacterized protein